MIVKINLGKDHMLQYGIVMTLSYASYSTLLYSVFGMSPILRTFLVLTVLGIDLFAIYKNINKIKPLVLIVCTLSMMFISTYILYPENRWVISSFVEDVVKYVMLAFFLCIASSENIFKSLKIAAYCILLCGMFEPFTHYVTGGTNGYMVYGMRILIAAVLFGYYYNRERRIIHLLATTISMLLILIYGNRSALLISVIAFGMQYIIYAKMHVRRARILFLGIVSVVMICFWGDILSGISLALERLGITSRTLNILLQGGDAVIDNTGRSLIWQNCRNAIMERPWTGYGIGGERNLYLLGASYVSRVGGVYAHNFVYEIILDFGLIIGTIILIIIAYSCIKIIRSKSNIEMSRLFTVLLVATGIKLWFSSSIWTDIDAYVCLGLAMHHGMNRPHLMSDVQRKEKEE